MFGLLIVYCSSKSLPPRSPRTQVTTVSKRCLFLVIHLGLGEGVGGLTFLFGPLVWRGGRDHGRYGCQAEVQHKYLRLLSADILFVTAGL